MRATLDHVQQEVGNIRTFWFKPESSVNYVAGQFIDLTLPRLDERHWFSLSSSPSESLLSITTRVEELRSDFKDALVSLKPGDEVLVSDPMGDFVLPKDATRPLVFIAGGIGITPVRSMIKWLHDQKQHRTIHILYAGTTLDDLAFRELLQKYGAPMDIILSRPPSPWEGHRGKLNAKKVLELAPDVDNKVYYISGPEPLVETLYKQLLEHDVSPTQLVADYFLGYTDTAN